MKRMYEISSLSGTISEIFGNKFISPKKWKNIYKEISQDKLHQLYLSTVLKDKKIIKNMTPLFESDIFTKQQ